MGFRRAAQLICLALFLGLLAGAGNLNEADLFLRMDPALVGVAALSARVLKWLFIPALIVLVSAFFFGRAFCGYICPMGTTIDLSDRCLKKRAAKAQNAPKWIFPHLNLYLLIFLAGAGLLGVSLIFWITPLGLITRLYGLLVYPLIELIADFGLAAIYPIANRLDIRSLMFAEIEPPRFAAQFFVLAVFILIFAAGRIAPRFWCRYLCPAGGMLALAARKPLIRRRVNDACNQCGICTRNCPMGAIDLDDPGKTEHAACIACRRCAVLCPQDAIEFGLTAPINAHAGSKTPISPSRRHFLLAGAAGMGTAALSLTGLAAATDKHTEGEVRAARLIRPPGALPEASFLSACVRCGECMTACPTNTLQPIWFDAGFLGMFSPAIVPRRKYCDPRCTICGEVCPTGAIRALSSGERVWAKTGTAVIYRQKCLAWEHQKSCMVCDEVCPYDAVEFEKKTELPYPVPHVKEDRCAGCGYCEYYCPVQNDAAIVVTPMDELRLKTGSYQETAKNRGYKMSLRPASDSLLPKTYPQGEDTGPPETDSGGPAPGFDPL